MHTRIYIFFLKGVCAPLQEVEGVQPHHRRTGGPAGTAQGAAGPTASAVDGGGSKGPGGQQLQPCGSRALFTSGWGVDKWSTSEKC